MAALFISNNKRSVIDPLSIPVDTCVDLFPFLETKKTL